MNSRLLTILALSAAILALSAAVIVRSVKRAETERYVAERAASEEEIRIRDARKAESERKAAEANARAKEAAQKASEAEKDRAIAAQKANSLEAAAAAKAAEKATADAAAKKDEARAASARLAEAKAVAAAKASEEAARRADEQKAKYEAEAAVAKAEAERSKAEAAVATAKTLELRKIDFETWQTRLAEIDQELTERERALRPEATIYDSSNITWVAEREPDVIGATGTVRSVRRAPVLPENDPSLPRPTRRLARCEREMLAQVTALEAASSNAVVTAFERLYAEARADGRTIDADYYARSIRLFYPQWVYRPKKEGGEP